MKSYLKAVLFLVLLVLIHYQWTQMVHLLFARRPMLLCFVAVVASRPTFVQHPHRRHNQRLDPLQSPHHDQHLFPLLLQLQFHVVVLFERVHHVFRMDASFVFITVALLRVLQSLRNVHCHTSLTRTARKHRRPHHDPPRDRPRRLHHDQHPDPRRPPLVLHLVLRHNQHHCQLLVQHHRSHQHLHRKVKHCRRSCPHPSHLPQPSTRTLALTTRTPALSTTALPLCRR
mmetsp:Transcript_2063/g.3412  ORF Transcript_2063/g.3412 Transcript_2063/m.3412 type:complete len:229 (-) Transcript_2063:1252-1938(-)